MIQSQDNTVTFIVSDKGEYLFPYKFFKPEDLTVFLGQKELVRGIDWSVEDKADFSDGAKIFLKSGTVNTQNPIGKRLIIQRLLPVTQDTSLPTNGKINSATLETQLDKIIMVCQQIQERTGRSLLMPPGEDGKDLQEVLGVINAAEKSAGEAATAAGEAATAAGEAATAAGEAATAAGEAATAAGEAATAAEEVAKRAMGLAIGTIFPFPASTPPEGAYLLNGQTIANCVALYPEFWEWVTTAGVRSIDSETYEAELASTGVCGGFVVDPSAGSVRLPTVVNGTLWGADSASIGQSLAAGLPNVTGSADVWVYSTTPPNKGALIATAESGSNGLYGTGNVAKGKVSLDASSSSAIYGNSATVQPPAIRVSWCIQVFNAATTLSEQQSAQLASQMQTYLPRAGGTMTGMLTFSSGDAIRQNNDSGSTNIFGGSAYAKGADMFLAGKDKGGAFSISADNGTTRKSLRGGTSGTLTWCDKDITLGYPNYAAGVAIGSVTSYTATGDGWVRLYVHGDNQVWTLQVNGISTHTYGGTQHDHATVLIPVKKGDVVKFVRSEGELVKTSWVFYPNR